MMKKRVSIITIICLLGVSTLLFLAGCGDKFFDPTQIGRFRPVPAVNVILDSLGVADEALSEWAAAEDPRPIDVMVFETDYTFAPGDILRVTIFELLIEGVNFDDNYIVTESGKLSIPEVGVIEVTGLTESQVEEEIRQILSPSILKEPLVTVAALVSQQRSYSILGNGVPEPGRYDIPRYDFRLNDALAIASVATQFNISNVYVTRAVTGEEALGQLGEQQVDTVKQPEQLEIPDKEMLEIIAPHAGLSRYGRSMVIALSEMVTDKELEEAALPEGFELSNDDNQSVDVGRNSEREKDKPIKEHYTERVEWIFRDGKWVPISVGEPKPKEAVGEEYKRPLLPPPGLKQRVPEEFDWEQIGTGGIQTRVIKIPTDKLAGGDPRYNIVVRPGDTIHVPVDIIGEFYIIGNVNNQGVVALTGRPMTLKMAIAAAGGLGPLAWPKRCEVTRRIGKNKEETVMVDLDKIANGEEPDFFIKPDDLINVGTHPTSRWRAVLRNAFRATYGFGFVYDRNFADRDYGTRRPIPHWF